MKLIKMLGLAAVAAMAAMALVGATSASAADTQLCNSHSALTCGSAATSVGVWNTGTGALLVLSLGFAVECDAFTASATPLALANPQSIHVTSLVFQGCETDENDGCTVSVLELPLFNLLKTGLDAGTLTATNGQAFVECEDVFFTVDVECTYDATGLQFTVGAQHLTAFGASIGFVSGDEGGDEGSDDGLCPEGQSTLDGLLDTKANRYILA